MQFLAVLVAAVASYAWGAVWYMVMAKPWMQAVGITEDQIDRKDPKPFVIAFVAAVLVAGMMRHIMATSGVDTAGGGLLTGLGLGLFIATPWIATNYTFGMRPRQLILIDGAYATVGCSIMGLVLGLF